MAYQLMFLRAVPGFEPCPRPLVGRPRLRVSGGGGPPGMAPGAVATGGPQMAQVIWAAVHGWVSLELDGLIFLADPAAGAEAMARSLVAGFRAPQD